MKEEMFSDVAGAVPSEEEVSLEHIINALEASVQEQREPNIWDVVPPKVKSLIESIANPKGWSDDLHETESILHDMMNFSDRRSLYKR